MQGPLANLHDATSVAAVPACVHKRLYSSGGCNSKGIDPALRVVGWAEQGALKVWWRYVGRAWVARSV